jgi:3-phenylpropionate/cinnamic acid dioxygenase small subunit
MSESEDISSTGRLERALLRSELEELVVESAYLLDRQRFDELIELHTEDCRVIRPLAPFTGEVEETIEGRAGLARQYDGPAWPKNPRTMRHVVANLHLETVETDRVTATVVLIGFRYEGAGVSLAEPMMVGDYEDEYQRGSDGRWRINRRRIHVAYLNQALLDAAGL